MKCSLNPLYQRVADVELPFVELDVLLVANELLRQRLSELSVGMRVAYEEWHAIGSCGLTTQFTGRRQTPKAAVDAPVQLEVRRHWSTL
jgi:hypothetical protein